VLLGLVLAIAIFGAFPLIDRGQWLGLALLVGVTALLFWIYLSPRRIPAKYLIPGTLFLLAFQVFPVLYTMSTAFTNFGDAHRGSKEDAIRAIEGASVTKVPGSADYRLSVATKGDPATGDIVFLLTDVETKQPFVGTTEGLEPLPADDVQFSPEGNITQAPGYTILSLGQAGGREEDLADFSVPTDKGAIVNAGLTRAFEGAPLRAYDPGCDCIKDQESGQTWTANDSDGLFVDDKGDNLAQGWQVNVGFRNFVDVVTDPLIAKYFFRTLLWNFAFAILTVALTFSLGLLVAIVLNHERLKGQRLYRSLLILPYAMPGFVMLLVWRDMFNTDFGLINRLFNSEVLVRDAGGRDGRGAARPGLDGLPLHVPGLHRGVTVHPRRPQGGGLGRRGQTRLRLPHDHLPAAAGRAGAADDCLLRLQLQQLQRDLPGQRGWAVPGRQPADRRDRPADHLHLPPRLRRPRGPVRVRRRGVDLHLPHRRRDLDHRLPPHPGPGGDQLMSETNTSSAGTVTAEDQKEAVVRLGSAKGDGGSRSAGATWSAWWRCSSRCSPSCS
jgi:ABC-type sugar transport system permease subunit